MKNKKLHGQLAQYNLISNQTDSSFRQQITSQIWIQLQGQIGNKILGE